MINLNEYKKIQELKNSGISKTKTSLITKVSYKTVLRWWDVYEEEFISNAEDYESTLSIYRGFIIEILKISPQISNTVLRRRVIEKFGEVDIPVSTFFRFIKSIRSETGLTKPPRAYQIRLETEPGYESQVDFGQYVMKTMYGNNKRIYFFVMTLSYSRMKYAYFSVDPFNAKLVIKAHNYAFKYFGGRTQMIVYDQDKTMIVSENFGDIIFNKDFEAFIKQTGFGIYLCRHSDPETKGKIEKTVDYVKHQFLIGRIFYSIDRLNADFLDWLDHDGNGMVNDTTKKAPRDMFLKESKHLIKVSFEKNDEIVVLKLKYDTVPYKDNLYKLPMKRIRNTKSVRVERYDESLLIYNAETSELLCKHKLEKGVGSVVPLPKMYEEKTTNEDELYSLYKGNKLAIKFLNEMKKANPRYMYSQCRRLQKMKRYYSEHQIEVGMKFCIEKKRCSMFVLSSFLLYKYGEQKAKAFLTNYKFKMYKDEAIKIKEELNG